MSRFARIPERLTQMLEHGGLTADHYVLMAYLVAKADYRRREVTFTSVRELAARMRWTRTERHLRDCLRELRDLREIAYEKSQGSRDPYVITIVRGDYFGSGVNLEQSDESDLEQRGNLEQEGPNLERARGSSFQVAGGYSKFESPADPQQQTESAQLPRSAVPSPTASTSKAKALRRETDALGKTTRTRVEVENSSAPLTESEFAAPTENVRRPVLAPDEDDPAWTTAWQTEDLADDVRRFADERIRGKLIEAAKRLPPCSTCDYRGFFSSGRCKQCGTLAEEWEAVVHAVMRDGRRATAEEEAAVDPKLEGIPRV